jgi:fumarylacetoacetate (FAA) hydrolase
MKLATLKDETIDGKLIVVSKDLKFYSYVSHIAQTMQSALDNWSKVYFDLKEISDKLNDNKIERFIFNERKVNSPLPRSYQWADCSAYVNHLKLVRKARGVELPKSYWNNPLIYQGGSDDFLSPRSPIAVLDEDWGVDVEAEVAVITDYIPMGSKIEKIKDKILMVMIANDISLRNLIPEEINKGFGFFQSKPSTSFSPVAVTIDELGKSWVDGKLHETIMVDLNNIPLGRNQTGEDMTFNFYELITHAAKTRNLSSGSIFGSGTISNMSSNGGPEDTIGQGGRGYSCIVEKRTVETIKLGRPISPYMLFGDTIRIQVLNKNKESIFGKIEQKLIKA